MDRMDRPLWLTQAADPGSQFPDLRDRRLARRVRRSRRGILRLESVWARSRGYPYPILPGENALTGRYGAGFCGQAPSIRGQRVGGPSGTFHEWQPRTRRSLLFWLLGRSLLRRGSRVGSGKLGCWRPLAAVFVLDGGAPAVAFDVELEDGGAVHQAVDGRHGHGVVGEDRLPLPERLVGGDQHRALLVACADELEQHARLGLILGDVGEIVELCGAPHNWMISDSSRCRSTSSRICTR